MILSSPANIEINNNVTFMRMVSLYAHESRGIRIGNNCAFNERVFIASADGGRIDIGDFVIVGPNTVIRASNHAFASGEVPISQQGHIGGEIVIQNDVWIGANCVILANVTIGRGVVIAAGSVVTKDLPSGWVCAGVPCKPLRCR
jgi:galactoside O-acetyltransferase